MPRCRCRQRLQHAQSPRASPQPARGIPISLMLDCVAMRLAATILVAVTALQPSACARKPLTLPPAPPSPHATDSAGKSVDVPSGPASDSEQKWSATCWASRVQLPAKPPVLRRHALDAWRRLRNTLYVYSRRAIESAYARTTRRSRGAAHSCLRSRPIPIWRCSMCLRDDAPDSTSSRAGTRAVLAAAGEQQDCFFQGRKSEARSKRR